MNRLQPWQLGNDSILNMVLYHLLDMRGGASLCKPPEIPGRFGVAPVIGVSGVATPMLLDVTRLLASYSFLGLDGQQKTLHASNTANMCHSGRGRKSIFAPDL